MKIIHKRMICCVVSLTCAAVCVADDSTRLLAVSRDTAPEFFAAAVLRQAKTGVPAGAADTSELIEEAFAVGGRAEEPVALAAVPGLAPDTRAFHRAAAGSLRLDTLSLQSDLAVAMIKFDPLKARKLFLEILPPPDRPASCEDPLIPDHSAYYRAARQILKNATPLPIIRTNLVRTDSPSDAAAFAELLASVQLNATEREALLGEFGAKLELMTPDYRSFGLTFKRLAAATSQIESENFRRSLQKFILIQESGPRCAENYTVSDLSLKVTPAGRGAAFVAESYSELPGSKAIEDAFAELKVSSDGPRSEEERSTDEWQLMLADFLSDFEAWNPSGTPIDVFHQQADYWRGLIEVTPSGKMRDSLLSRAGSFLASSRMSREHPAEWLWQVEQTYAAAGADKTKLRVTSILQTFSGPTTDQ